MRCPRDALLGADNDHAALLAQQHKRRGTSHHTTHHEACDDADGNSQPGAQRRPVIDVLGLDVGPHAGELGGVDAVGNEQDPAPHPVMRRGLVGGVLRHSLVVEEQDVDRVVRGSRHEPVARPHVELAAADELEIARLFELGDAWGVARNRQRANARDRWVAPVRFRRQRGSCRAGRYRQR